MASNMGFSCLSSLQAVPTVRQNQQLCTWGENGQLLKRRQNRFMSLPLF